MTRSDWNDAIEAAAAVVDECNREGPYQAIAAARRIRALKRPEEPGTADDKARIRVLEAALREHHDWHMRSGTIGLQDGDGGWIEIDNTAEYADSAMYERTEKLLAGAPPQELQPMPRGGMNTWWWEQAVLLRRRVRELEKKASAAPEPPKEGEVERLREALQGALAEHDFKREQQVMLTEPGWVDKARAALNEGRADG